MRSARQVDETKRENEMRRRRFFFPHSGVMLGGSGGKTIEEEDDLFSHWAKIFYRKQIESFACCCVRCWEQVWLMLSSLPRQPLSFDAKQMAGGVFLLPRGCGATSSRRDEWNLNRVGKLLKLISCHEPAVLPRSCSALTLVQSRDLSPPHRRATRRSFRLLICGFWPSPP